MSGRMASFGSGSLKLPSLRLRLPRLALGWPQMPFRAANIPGLGSINRYIFGSTFSAFMIVLFSLTAVIWITQALRDIDLMTNRGQSVLVFIGITGLIIPQLVLIIAPIALVMAIAHTLNKLSTDSEIIVMNAAGMPPWRLFRPFLAVTIIGALMITVVSAYVAPEGLRMLRRWVTQVRTDLISNIVQPGRFTQIDRGLTFFIRERLPNGLLIGIMLDDRRDEKERVTILAEQGEIVRNDAGSFIVFETGSIQRHEAKQIDPSIVQFERYAFDLSQYGGGVQVVNYSVRERYLWELAWPDPNDPQYKNVPAQCRTEFHDRILGPVYPVAFLVLAYAFLGAPSTTRQSRLWSILALTVCVVTLRLMGFVTSIVGVTAPVVIVFQYLVLFGTIAAGLFAISRGVIIEPPAKLVAAVNSVTEYFRRRGATAAGQTT
jgi:lipopolysaccharide export system permease protein